MSGSVNGLPYSSDEKRSDMIFRKFWHKEGGKRVEHG